MSPRAGLLVAALALAPAAAGGAGEAPMAPSGRTLVERYTAALGGAEAIRRRPAVRIVGELRGRDGRSRIEVLRAPPGRLKVEVRRADGSTVRWGFDGSAGWVQGADGSLRTLAGAALDDLRRDADFYRPLLAQEGWDGIETLGWTDTGAGGCWEVRLDLPDLRERVLCIDPEEHLVRAAREERAGPWGVLKVERGFEEYRRFGDLLLPAVQHQLIHGERSTVRLTEVVEIEDPDAAWFRRPGGGR